MAAMKFYNSVRLDQSLCKGCINCIKRCPTQAIRVHNGKAAITKKFCIDCGECIRICPHHAKLATYDKLEIIGDYEYTVALPAPTLYGQFNNLDDVNIVLNALKKIGFDDVFEVSAAAEMISEMTRTYVEEHPEKYPIISTACPSVVRLIRVRFPNLIENMLPFNTPMDLAAKLARKKAVEQTGLPPEKIGIIFISPCPAKVTSVRAPIGIERSEVDGVVAIKDIYQVLLSAMKISAAEPDAEEPSCSGKIGIGWASSGGEASGLLSDSYLAADGIENVIHVLEDLEDQKFPQLEFVELNACSGGCVGGVLTVENPYIAKAKIKRLRKYLPVSMNHLDGRTVDGARLDLPIEYEPVFRLGTNFKESLTMMAKVEDLMTKFPGLDCGSCGAPTCKALAEDIVRGEATERDCIHLLRKYIHELSGEIDRLDGR